jgi:hypothetical protein
VQQKPLDHTGGKPQRLPEIDEKHDPRVRRAIPGLVLLGVIENDNLALAPAVDFVPEPDAEHVAWLTAQSDRDAAPALRCKDHGVSANTFYSRIEYITQMSPGLDQGKESESAGSYPRHRRYVLDKFSRLNARIYCSWHRFETFPQGRLPELSPDCLLPLPPDRNRTRAREEPQPTTDLWLFLSSAVN